MRTGDGAMLLTHLFLLVAAIAASTNQRPQQQDDNATPTVTVGTHVTKTITHSRRNRGNPLKAEMQEFEGYDCSIPEDVRMLEAAPPKRDCDLAAEVKRTKNSTYVFLQKAETSTIPLVKCTVKMTTDTAYCGVYDHVTTLATIDLKDEPVVFTDAECRRMAATGTYKHFLGGIEQPIEVNHTTRFKIQEAGYNQLQEHHADCVGGSWTPPDWLRRKILRHGPWAQELFSGSTISGIVRTVFMEVRVEVLPAILTHEDQTLTIEEEHRNFPGLYPLGSFQTDESTYAWAIERDTCRFFVVRQLVTGQDIETDRGTVFQSDGQTMVRLVKKRQVPACGTTVTATNFPQAFLGRVDDVEKFGEALSLREYSTHLFFNIQDAYIFNFLKRYVHETVQETLADQCRRDRQNEDEAYADLVARQLAMTAGGTARISANRFAQAAGEAYALFTCRPIVATIRVTESCYNVIPVFLQSDDEIRYKRQRGLTNDSVEFFLEPQSRMLTTVAAEEPCAELLRPIFKNRLGYWVTGGARVELVAHPKKMSSMVDHGRGIETIREAAFEDNGWYTPASIRNLDRFRMLAQSTAAVTRKMAMQGDLTSTGPLSSLSANQVFPDMPNWKEWVPSFDVWGRIWGFLKDWGALCSTFAGIYLLGRLLYWGFWVVARLCSQREGGLFSHVFGAFFPNFHDFASSRGSRQMGKRMSALFRPKDRRKDRGDGDGDGEGPSEGATPIGKAGGSPVVPSAPGDGPVTAYEMGQLNQALKDSSERVRQATNISARLQADMARARALERPLMGVAGAEANTAAADQGRQQKRKPEDEIYPDDLGPGEGQGAA